MMKISFKNVWTYHTLKTGLQLGVSFSIMFKAGTETVKLIQ